MLPVVLLAMFMAGFDIWVVNVAAPSLQRDLHVSDAALHKFTPSKNFAWMVHIDGLRERHDESVSKEGVFDQAVAAIKLAKEAGFQVYTNTTFFNRDTPQTIIETLDYLNDVRRSRRHADRARLRIRESAGSRVLFLGVEQTRAIFREALSPTATARVLWRLNHTPLYLDFLDGKVDFACTAWGIPSYSIFGWQRPCYLMSDGDYAGSYKELLERRPIGRNTAADVTRNAKTAWRTAATSRLPCWPP